MDYALEVKCYVAVQLALVEANHEKRQFSFTPHKTDWALNYEKNYHVRKALALTRASRYIHPYPSELESERLS